MQNVQHSPGESHPEDGREHAQREPSMHVEDVYCMYGKSMALAWLSASPYRRAGIERALLRSTPERVTVGPDVRKDIESLLRFQRPYVLDASCTDAMRTEQQRLIDGICKQEAIASLVEEARQKNEVLPADSADGYDPVLRDCLCVRDSMLFLLAAGEPLTFAALHRSMRGNDAMQDIPIETIGTEYGKYIVELLAKKWIAPAVTPAA